MEEKLNDAEIDKLRAIVGEDSGTSDYFAEAGNSSLPQKKTAIVSKPILAQAQPHKKAEKAPLDSQQSIDTELFVKVEEHAAIGGKLLEAKSDMKTIADTISLLAKAEKLKSEAITRMEGALDKIDADIGEIEAKLVAPEGLNVPEINISEDFVSGNLFDLRSELDALKSELGKINKS